MSTELANKYFKQALIDNGLEGGAMNFDPPTAGKVTRRYQELMRAAGYCPCCERKLSGCICEVDQDQQ
jgi:hypothetical protein